MLIVIVIVMLLIRGLIFVLFHYSHVCYDLKISARS